ncbi:snRNA-activating protein complex subunit 1b isoform X2 [Mobula hypostoma]|uniref:snRNA-activating protein complex subunit 1b isoform X2 n=1 Tax=Mobula hypostoma TaxID=723540 RepID=UPI002FC34E46
MSLTAGLKTDYERLLLHFQQTGSVRYEEFSAIWRDMKFSTIFYGKMGKIDRRTFAREALALASRYFFPPYSFQIRLGGLYLLYGLYNTQLCQPKEKIRIALKNWDEVVSCQEEMVNAEHFDAVYILKKLLNDKAFHFTAMPTLELTNVHEHYQAMKHTISANKTQLDKALSLIRGNFVSDLKNIAVEFQQWQENKNLNLTDQPGIPVPEDDEPEAHKGSRRAQTLAEIKSKSYNSVVKVSRSRRHRQVKTESDQTTEKKPPEVRNSSVKNRANKKESPRSKRRR